MNFLMENWVYIVALALFVGMHLFGSSCGRGRRFGPERRPNRRAPEEASAFDGSARQSPESDVTTPDIRTWI